MRRHRPRVSEGAADGTQVRVCPLDGAKNTLTKLPTEIAQTIVTSMGGTNGVWLPVRSCHRCAGTRHKQAVCVLFASALQRSRPASVI